MTTRIILWRSVWLPYSETFIANELFYHSAIQALPVGLSSESNDLLLSRGSTPRIIGSAGPTGRVRNLVFRYFGLNRKFDKIVEEFSPSIIHSHFAPDAMGIMCAARRHRLPHVVTLHGYDLTSLPAKSGVRSLFYRRRLRKLFRSCDLIICVSDFIRERAISLGADPALTVRHYLGIPLASSVDGLSRRGLDSYEANRVLFVGRLTEKKGLFDLISACANVQSSLPGVSLTVVGDGSLMDSAQTLANDLGVDAHFLGKKTPLEVAELMLSSSVFCVPSKTSADGDSEGFGLVFLEAAASGLPVVSYYHGGIPEAVLNDVTGFLVEEGDVNGLSRALLKLLKDPSLAQQYGVNGFQRVHEDFDLKDRILELEMMIEELADR